jgi:hypothetical protein
MKIPKWLVAVVVLFCVIAPCTTGGWLWVNWPDKTAEGFVRAIAEGNFDAANADMPHDSEVKVYWALGAKHELELHTSFWDERKDGCWVFSSLSSYVYTRDFWDLVTGERTIVISAMTPMTHGA